MENKWEYDYSGLYHNGYTPAPGPYQPFPRNGRAGPPGLEPPRKKKKAGAKDRLRGAGPCSGCRRELRRRLRGL